MTEYKIAITGFTGVQTPTWSSLHYKNKKVFFYQIISNTNLTKQKKYVKYRADRNSASAKSTECKLTYEGCSKYKDT